jgi:hypothetical protein
MRLDGSIPTMCARNDRANKVENRPVPQPRSRILARFAVGMNGATLSTQMRAASVESVRPHW